MKVLFYTYGMVPGTERLMPWRTLVEVARWMNTSGRHEAAICSVQPLDSLRVYEGVAVYSVESGFEPLRRLVEQGHWNSIFYPVTYRQGLRSLDGLSQIPAEIIAYIPGGLSPMSGTFELIKQGYWNLSKPYLFDVLIPHKWLIKRLHQAGIIKMVCQAPLTAQDVVSHGMNKAEVFCALPGKDVNVVEDDSLVKALGLESQRFLLFSGAPSPVRGAVMALKAFDTIAERVPNVKLVMLMRRDVSSDFRDFEAAVKEVMHKEQVIVRYDRVSKEQLFGMFKVAWAVLLPFLIVPSEIPLTFFEVMSLGTPVVTFENGGTTDYLRKGLKIASKRSVRSLGEAMVDICQNENERNMLSKEAKIIMEKHPTWEQTAEIWEKAIKGQNA